jgi:uncharacterized protein (TIGR04141 family)
MPRTRSLSIYLLRRDVHTPDDAVKSHHSIRRVPIGHGRGAVGVLFHRTTSARPPRWIEFFGSHVNQNDFLSSSTSAVLVVRSSSRLFALTFGHGWHLLKPGSYEEDFGLRVTLNSVSPDRVRTIDRKALDATGRHSREQASKNIAIIEFGLDIDKDILRAVTGPPEDLTLGGRLAGADALSVVTQIELSNLSDRLQHYLAQYRKRTYRDRFPWVDNIREVGDAALSKELDGVLERRIRERHFDRIWMAVPDLVDWHDVAGLTFSRAEEPELLDDISFDSYLDQLRHPEELSIVTLRRHRVFCISAETDLPKAEWSVYKCIYAELDRDSRTFLLNSGRWYEVANDYVREVDRAIRRIPASSMLQLPDYEDSSEAEYNRRVHSMNPATYALMDRRTIRYGGGSSRIEFCDLYTRRKEMVHVKRYSGSGTLSHLFAQGSVSANLFLNDQRFRKEVNRLLPPSHQLRSLGGQLRTSDYEVAYAIASKADGPLVLPFFSRVTLRSAHTQLKNMGFRVTLTKIPCR